MTVEFTKEDYADLAALVTFAKTEGLHAAVRFVILHNKLVQASQPDVPTPEAPPVGDDSPPNGNESSPDGNRGDAG